MVNHQIYLMLDVPLRHICLPRYLGKYVLQGEVELGHMFTFTARISGKEHPGTVFIA